MAHYMALSQLLLSRGTTIPSLSLPDDAALMGDDLFFNDGMACHPQRKPTCNEPLKGGFASSDAAVPQTLCDFTDHIKPLHPCNKIQDGNKEPVCGT
eukprot:5214779-Amphidinium_carterae.2